MKEAKDMKEGWEYKKLGEACDVIENISWSDVDDNTTYQYIDLSAVNRNTYSIDDTTTISKSDAPSRAKQIVKHKDILFGTTRPLLKRVCVVPVENDNNICSTGFCVLRPKNNMILSKWVFYQLLSEKYYNFIEPLQSGANYPAVSDRIVKSYIIPLPSLSEQQQIVSELDLLSGVIEKQKAQLEELDKLAQSIFYDMFGDPVTNEKGWEMKMIGDICLKITDGSHNPPKGVDFSEYLMLSSKNVTNQGFTFDEPRYLTKEQFDVEDKRTKVQKGDVFLVIVGASVGKCCIYQENYSITLQRSVAVLRPNTKVLDSVYLKDFLVASHSLIVNEAKGAAQKGIYLNQLAKVNIPLPPLSLQQVFAAKVEAIEAMKAKVRQSIKETETLFNERMDYYFN